MKKILIALDYSLSAQKIAESGFNLAKALNAQTILLHVTSIATYYSSLGYSPIMGFDNFSQTDVVERDTTTELMKVAERYLHKVKEHLGDPTIQTILLNGDSAEGILTTAADLKADLIVIGTHSRHGLEKILLGSVAEKVLHHSLIPLFIIPIKSLQES
jgi:nucleotide-binding universal stress UspA family protein